MAPCGEEASSGRQVVGNSCGSEASGQSGQVATAARHVLVVRGSVSQQLRAADMATVLSERSSATEGPSDSRGHAAVVAVNSESSASAHSPVGSATDNTECSVSAHSLDGLAAGVTESSVSAHGLAGAAVAITESSASAHSPVGSAADNLESSTSTHGLASFAAGILESSASAHDLAGPVAGIAASSASADVREEAALRLQSGWRASSRRRRTSIEDGWVGARARRLGSLEAHVRYLQFVVRHTMALRRDCWRRGGLRGPLLVVRWLISTRLARSHRCGDGSNLASESEFVAQQARAEHVLDWYRQYVQLLRRLTSGETPTVLQSFCGGGGSTEGVRRAGGASHGIDDVYQPDHVRRFGEGSFTVGDATSRVLVDRLRKEHRAFGVVGGPPCKPYSTADVEGKSTAPALIEETRDGMRELFDESWALENVKGASKHMSANAVELRGSDFGLRVDRPRLYETGFPLHVDRYLRESGERLRARCCLGSRRRWRRLDAFGRPEACACCAGNIFAVQGTHPWRSTAAECSRAMGVDVGTMEYERLAQAVPPVYAELVFGQMCMWRAHVRFGAPAISFDEMLERPAASRRELARWLHGAGDDRPEAGLALEKAREHREAVDASHSLRSAADRVTGGMRGWIGFERLSAPDVTTGSESATAGEAAWPEQSGAQTAPSAAARKSFAGEGRDSSVLGFVALDEADFREVYYSHAGGFDQQWVELGAPQWLRALVPADVLVTGAAEASELAGRNTFVEVCEPILASALPVMEEALQVPGTRLTVVASVGQAAELRALGFEVLYRLEAGERVRDLGGGRARLSEPRLVLCAGSRRGACAESRLDHEAVRPHLDPRDRGEGLEPKEAKAARSWRPMPHDPELWRGKGMPAEVEHLMVEGAQIDAAAEVGFFEVPQYEWPSDQGLVEAILECDRHLAIGAVEYVPDDQLERVLRDSAIHPWVCVQQGAEKWRACLDVSVGTNRVAPSAPFALPTVWDVRRVLKPDSHFAKYDLRDGFFAVPVHPDSRHRLVMRHPGTGRLMWCRRLPFGYVDSPRLFCSVTEALAAELRRRVAGFGIHVFVYCDDWLVVGDTEAATRLGCEMLEALLFEFGMEWAPHKQRGPCRVIEFLGMLLSNAEGVRCIALTESRQLKLRGMLDEWSSRRPSVRLRGGLGDGGISGGGRADGGSGGCAAAACSSGREEEALVGLRRVADESEIEVETLELARLLGHLVFASQAIPGGRTFMQGMTSSFKGLEVDWRRSQVRVSRGRGDGWRRMRVGGAFWRDLEWLSEHLERRNCVSIETEELGEAAITGTDASGWGTGQLVWIDGGREETSLRFTEAERRRPINWRELLGIVRILEVWGPRLAGRCVLIESDSMAALGAAGKMASSSEDMQELIRRLLELSERYSISLRFTHTPGVKLLRPDQTSRGDPVEEPRQRLRAATFASVARRWGPFTEWIGSERRHGQQGSLAADGARLFVHPSHSTVGSAMRLIGERLSERDGERVRGVIIVPHDESAAWWPLTRHFQVVERLPAGGSFLEANSLGRWQPMAAHREALLLAFPRAEAAKEMQSEEAASALACALAPGMSDLDGASAELTRARASADEAAEARRHPTRVSS